MSPLPTSPAVPMWREMPVFRAFLYITFRVPNKESILQVPLTELPKREMFRFQALLQVSEYPPPPTSHGSQWSPYGERCPSPEPT